MHAALAEVCLETKTMLTTLSKQNTWYHLSKYVLNFVNKIGLFLSRWHQWQLRKNKTIYIKVSINYFRDELLKTDFNNNNKKWKPWECPYIWIVPQWYFFFLVKCVFLKNLQLNKLCCCGCILQLSGYLHSVSEMKWKCWGEQQERTQPCDLVWREDRTTPRLQSCLPIVPEMDRTMNTGFMWITAEGKKQVMHILCLCGTYLVSFSTGHCIISLCTGLNQITAEYPHPAFHSCSLALAHNQGFLPT